MIAGPPVPQERTRTPDPRPLGGRVVIVTGAARGLGRAYARHLAALGAHVVVNNRRSAGPGPEAVVDEVLAAGGSASASIADVRDWGAAQAMVEETVERFGALHALVNNAGTMWDGPLHRMTEEQWDEVVSVNLKGHVAPICAAVAHWLARGPDELRRLRPSVVTTSSGAAMWGLGNCLNYAATKGAILSLTTAAALELDPHGIRVNCVAPVGRTRWQALDGSVASTARELMQPPTRWGAFDVFDAANVAPTVAWLCSAGCSVTGQVLRVLGGRVDVLSGWHVDQSVEHPGRWSFEGLSAALDGVRWPAATSTFRETARSVGRLGADEHPRR